MKLRMMAVGGENGGPLVPHYGAQAQGIRRYVGRRLDPSQGSLFESREIVKGPNGKPQLVTVTRRNAVFVPSAEPVMEVDETDPHVSEYIRHMRDGDLLPADAATAKLAGVPFDPKCSKSLHKIAVAEAAASGGK
jgi:hypothetical protein